jgi:hypothetical protein
MPGDFNIKEQIKKMEEWLPFADVSELRRIIQMVLVENGRRHRKERDGNIEWGED